jgi:DNA-binding ferritin-like protein
MAKNYATRLAGQEKQTSETPTDLSRDDVATASLIENWIDQTERRTWFLSEIIRDL